MKTATINREHICDFVAEIEPLLRLHYAEIVGRDASEVEPDWDQYLALEQAKTFVAHVARDAQDHIVAYACFFIVPDFHRRGRRLAQNDVFFVHPRNRDGALGPRMIGWCEKDMQQRGANEIIWSARAGTVLEKMLPVIGYENKERPWSKTLKE